jgi:hypothetical protein
MDSVPARSRYRSTPPPVPAWSRTGEPAGRPTVLAGPTVGPVSRPSGRAADCLAGGPPRYVTSRQAGIGGPVPAPGSADQLVGRRPCLAGVADRPSGRPRASGVAPVGEPIGWSTAATEWELGWLRPIARADHLAAGGRDGPAGGRAARQAGIGGPVLRPGPVDWPGAAEPMVGRPDSSDKVAAHAVAGRAWAGGVASFGEPVGRRRLAAEWEPGRTGPIPRPGPRADRLAAGGGPAGGSAVRQAAIGGLVLETGSADRLGVPIEPVVGRPCLAGAVADRPAAGRPRAGELVGRSGPAVERELGWTRPIPRPGRLADRLASGRGVGVGAAAAVGTEGRGVAASGGCQGGASGWLGGHQEGLA